MIQFRHYMYGTPAEPPPDQADDPRWDDDGGMAIRAEARMQGLRRLAEMSLEAAEALHARLMDRLADEDASDETVASLASAHTRVTRAVRQAFALEARFDREHRAWGESLAAKDPMQNISMEPAAITKVRNRMKWVFRVTAIEEAVRQVIRAQAAPADAPRLHEHLNERLNDRDDYNDLGARPISKMIGRICHHLGLAEPDWTLWDDRDWAIAEAEYGEPGSKYLAEPGEDGGGSPGRTRERGPP